ncbi:MAG: hypothetical protein VB133_09460 [Anaeromusa sp.]|uniref:hypothetical protein n=1 Tax=Anaeromusa sp. TaxID=1872520 RepID=UPI002B1EAD13|nr:hypothetical protein [Anaeromusa sp.]MEA4835350.1 hypothetical protein [Anaeromusa sp.]
MFTQEIDKLLTALSKSPDYAGIIEQKELVHQIAEKDRETKLYELSANERLIWGGMMTGFTVEQKVMTLVVNILKGLGESKDEIIEDGVIVVLMPMLDNALQEGYGERRRTS